MPDSLLVRQNERSKIPSTPICYRILLLLLAFFSGRVGPFLLFFFFAGPLRSLGTDYSDLYPAPSVVLSTSHSTGTTVHLPW